MKHHLTFKKRNSNQFWQIEVSGNSFTVAYGKTGSRVKHRLKTSTIRKLVLEKQKNYFLKN